MKLIAPKQCWLSVMITYKQAAKKAQNCDHPLHSTYKTEVIAG
tara:strand:+ start:354 stop:482 length:129 start_codon:yes stop_codon:yes gene_type:complete